MKIRRRGFVGKDGRWVFSKRESRIFRAQYRRLREAAADARRREARLGPVPRFAEAQRQHELKYLRDSAISAIQAFSESYHGKVPYGSEDALDTTARFFEAYERHSGKTKTVEKRVMKVRHTQGCGEVFTVAMPGAYKLVDSEGGRLRSAQMRPVECPSCGKTVRVRLPEGLAIVKSDEGNVGDASTRQDGHGTPLGMDSEREPDRGDTMPDDPETGDDDPGYTRDDDGSLRRVRGDDAEDEEEDEDEEESEGGEDEDEAERFRGDEVYDGRRGPTPDESPRSGPFRPGAGSRDSLRQYYDERGGGKLVRLAKQSESKRVREAAQAFLRVLNEGKRFSRPV